MEDNCVGSCVSCLKVIFSLFSELSPEELKIINKGRTKYYYKPGDIIFKEGSKPSGLYCLNDGNVKIVKQGNIEEEFIIGLQKPVDFIGFESLMADMPFDSTAIALNHASVCIIKKEHLFKVINQNNILATKITLYFSRKLIEHNEKLLVLTQSKLESRLAYILLELINFFGYREDNKTIAIELKRKEIASLANMNTANVIRVMSQFKKQGILDTNLRKISILKIDELKKLMK